MDTPETPHERLELARERKGIKTAVEAAARLGMSPTTYQNYEDGSRGFSRHLTKLSTFYGVRPQWLQSGQGPMMTSDVERKYSALNPTNQEKAWEYMEMLESKQKT